MLLKRYLLLVIIAGCLLRLQNFHLLPIDGHAMRQTDTESVAYYFATTGNSILYPQASLIRPPHNIHSYFFLEFPSYSYLLGQLYRLFGTHIEVVHLFNIGLYIVAAVSCYVFVKRFIDERTALWAAFFYTMAPASIFFLGHAVHPDVFAVTLTLLSLATYVLWKEHKNPWLFIVSMLALALSIGTRPFNLLVVPAFLFLAWTYRAYWWEYPFIAFGGFGLYMAWKSWQTRFPEADSTWQEWTLQRQDLLFKKEILVDQLILKNIVGEVVGKVISLLAGVGVVSLFIRRNKVSAFVLLWLVGVPAYWYFAPAGNIYHQYYADVYLIPLVMAAAYGTSAIMATLGKKSRIIQWGLALLIIVAVVFNGYRVSQYFFAVSVPASHIKIAQEMAAHIPPDSKVMYLVGFNSNSLSLAHRKGWILGAYPDVDRTISAIYDLKYYGASYVVAGANNTDLPEEELAKLLKEVDLVYKSKWVAIYKYRNSKNP